MGSIIRKQYKEALRTFPYLQQTSDLTLSIHFNQDSSSYFEIIFTELYPKEPPKIINDMKIIDIPILRIWEPFFTITNILEQVQTYNSVPSPKVFSLSWQEVQEKIIETTDDKLMTESGMNKLIAELPSIQKARKAAQEAQSKAGEEKPNLNRLRKEMFNLIREVVDMCNERDEILERVSNDELNEQNMLSEIMSIKNIINEQREELKKNQEIEKQILNNIRNRKGPCTHGENIFKLQNIKKSIIKSQLIIDKLEDLLSKSHAF